MKRLVLLGGGHAHVQVVRSFAASPPADTAVVLINRTRLTPYSGMLPGLIAGHYTTRDSHIDLAWLCADCGIAFVQAEATALDPARRCLFGTGADEHPYDVLSIDTGSTPPLDTVPGARDHAIPVKPIDEFIAAIDRLLDTGAMPDAIAIVGTGAAGFEVVLALDHRLRQRFGAQGLPTLWLVGDSEHILPDFPARVRRCAERRLRQQGIRIRAGARVAAVHPDGLLLESGERIPAEHAIFVTGAAPDPMFARSGLRTDPRGFVAVSAALQSLSHADVFACGDVATVVDHPRPKAGVFAVRQGPALTRNLRRALAGEAPLAFVPQERYLALLSTGRKHAIANRGIWTVEGEWVWRWKDWIDRRFVARFVR